MHKSNTFNSGPILISVKRTDRISYVSEFFFTLIALFWFGSPPFDEEILRLSNTTLTIIIQQIGRDKGLERLDKW